MKKIILIAAALLFSCLITANAQPYIVVNNNTGRTVDIHIYSYSSTGAPCGSSDIIFNAYRFPGNSNVTYDFALANNSTLPTGASFPSPYTEYYNGAMAWTAWNFYRGIVSSDCSNSSFVMDATGIGGCSPSAYLGAFDATCVSPFSFVDVKFFQKSANTWELDIY